MPRIPPPVYLVAGLVTQRALMPEARAGRVRTTAAAALAAGSVGLLASADVAFHRHATTISPLDPAKASAIVTDGPFRFTRNPMYVGMAGLLAAHAVRRGGLLPLLPVAAFVGVIDRLQIAAEEKALADKFAGEYEAYLNRVPRWLGPPR